MRLGCGVCRVGLLLRIENGAGEQVGRGSAQLGVSGRGGDWNAKVGSQETPGVTGKFGLGIQNEAGQRLIEFCQENTLVTANTLFQYTREDSTRGHHQMVNTKIRLIIFFAAKDGEALYSQQNKTGS